MTRAEWDRLKIAVQILWASEIMETVAESALLTRVEQMAMLSQSAQMRLISRRIFDVQSRDRMPAATDRNGE
jgi:hypothetical protein